MASIPPVIDSNEPPALVRTDLPLAGRRQGKVRDTYDLPPDPRDPERRPRILVVATDRLSAFDVVLPTPIPGKGRLLTEISTRWMRLIEARGLSPVYVLSTEAADIPGLNPEQRAALAGRATIGVRRRVVPIECVARGYLAGSGWVEYQKSQTVCGVALPAGLRQGDRLPEPIFTPATKAEEGHDENISFERASELVGRPLMERLRDRTLAIYRWAAEHALARGVIVADTKFEFGLPLDCEDGEPVLIDEALTPDSSRFWPAEVWRPGGEQPSFDKQFVRDYLLGLVRAGAWDKTPPGPPIPPEVVRATCARYAEALERLFG